MTAGAAEEQSARGSGTVPRALRGASLGAAATAGWLANDVAVFFLSSEPAVCWALVPGSLVALAVGTALGALAGRFPPLVAAYAVAGLVLAKLPPQPRQALIAAADSVGVSLPGTPLLPYLGTVVVGWSLVVALAGLAHRLPGLPAARTAACLGLVAAIQVGDVAQNELRPHWQVLMGAALAVLVLGHRRVPFRRAATGAVLLGTGLFVGYHGLAPARPSYWRSDLPPPTASGGEAPNAVLVVLDTLRAQNLAPYGAERVTTPEIDAWVREHATVFTESRSTSSFTLASHGSLFTGVLPARHKAARLKPASAPLDPGLETLADRLRAQGHRTAAVVANHTYLHPRYDMDRGFEHFDTRNGAFVGRYLPLAQLLGHRPWAGHLGYRDAHAITGAAFAWIDRRPRGDPFFLMLNYLDAHSPYIARAPHDAMFAEVRFSNPFGVPKEHRELAYDRNVHYLDSQIGRLLRGLEERGLHDDTLIVITSDHGEGFGEHGFNEHCWVLYEEMVKVPLYVKPPDGRRALADDRPVNSADVMWMVLDELGVPHEPPPDTGLVAEWYRQVPMTDNYLALQERIDVDLDRDLVAWIEDGRKYIVSTRREVEAYDLETDPWEEHPLDLTQEESDRAVVRAMQWWDAHPLSAEQTETIPAEEMERLRALGYVGPAGEGE